MAILEILLLLAVLGTAAGILFTKGIQRVVRIYLAFSILLALLWDMLYGFRLAVTVLGVGVVLTGLLLFFAMRKLQEEKGKQDEAETT